MSAPSSLGDRLAVSPTIIRILQVLTVVGLSAILYLTVTTIPANPARAPLDMSVSADGTANWSVIFTLVPPGNAPSDLHLLIRDSSHRIALPRTTFANLTTAAWAQNHAVYVDGNPTTLDVRPGDLLRLDRGTYAASSTIEISDASSILALRALS